MKEGGSGREIVIKEVGWSKSGIADRIVKSNRQTYELVNKDSPLTFDVNEGTYMDRLKQNDQKGVFRKAQIKKQVGIICTLGEVEITIKLGGLSVELDCGGYKIGLGGPRNTTVYLKNG